MTETVTLTPVQLDLMQRAALEADQALERIQRAYMATLTNVASDAGVPEGVFVSFDPAAGALICEDPATEESA